MTFAWHCLCGTLNLDGLDQVGDASLESEQERRHGMTGAEWRVATALFTAGEVITCTHINRKSTIQRGCQTNRQACCIEMDVGAVDDINQALQCNAAAYAAIWRLSKAALSRPGSKHPLELVKKKGHKKSFRIKEAEGHQKQVF